MRGIAYFWVASGLWLGSAVVFFLFEQRLEAAFILGLFVIPILLAAMLCRRPSFRTIHAVVSPLVVLNGLLALHGLSVARCSKPDASDFLLPLSTWWTLGWIASGGLTMVLFYLVVRLIWHHLATTNPSEARDEVAAVFSLFLSFTLASALLLSFYHQKHSKALRFVDGAILSNECKEDPDEEGKTGDEEAKIKIDNGPWILLFSEGSIQLDTQEEDNLQPCANGWPDEAKQSSCASRYSCKASTYKLCYNVQSLQGIAEAISRREPVQRLQIRLTGRASDRLPVEKGVTSDFSNFDYSEARIIQARSAIEAELWERAATENHKPLNIEWVYIPASNENIVLDGFAEIANLGDRFAGEQADQQLGEKLAVHVEVRPIANHLSQLQLQSLLPSEADRTLLDYIYFMVYTVTTTGYGDIVPVSAVPKMVTILGNLFEVVALIVLLGVVLSRYTGGNASKGAPGPEKPDDGADDDVEEDVGEEELGGAGDDQDQ